MGRREAELYSEPIPGFGPCQVRQDLRNHLGFHIWHRLFGTPHRGGNHAELGDIASSIARSITGSPENTFMKALKARSWFLEHISDDFRQLLEDFQILSFYETRPVYPIGLVSTGAT